MKLLKFIIKLLFGSIVIGITLYFSVGPTILYFGRNAKIFRKETTAESYNNALNLISDIAEKRSNILSKWESPILLRYEGSPTKEDLSFLNKIIDSFNSIDGFPTIALTNENENVLVYYSKDLADFREFKLKMDDNTINDVSHTYTSFKNNIITSGYILLKNEFVTGYKNAVTLHEFFHLIGFVHTTKDNNDSIMNTKKAVCGLSSTDILAFKMLYHYEIKSGVTYSQFKEFYEQNGIDIVLNNSNK